jgi:beta-glucosidase
MNRTNRIIKLAALTRSLSPHAAAALRRARRLRCSSGRALVLGRERSAENASATSGAVDARRKASLLIDKAPAIERLGIPKYDAWNEALHGVAWRDGVTVFPQAIGLASTWDPELMQRVATAISTEARALYNKGNFGLTLWSPVINIARDPRWGRTQEGYGEDPFLVSRMAVAFVKGIQGDHPFYLRAVATPKHYALNNVEATRFSSSSDVAEEVIRDYYLPHFPAAIVEGGAQASWRRATA